MKALTVIGLPVMVEREVHPGIIVDVPSGETIRFEPGDTITEADLTKAGQTPEQIAEMIEYGSLSEDDNAPLHPDHQPVVIDGSNRKEAASASSDE